MPHYVSDPGDPGNWIDVIKLQDRDAQKVLNPDPRTFDPWMKRDAWSRREALMLLAGYNPSVTQWTETSDGFGQFSAGNRGYVDGMSDSMIEHANVHWRHPRHDEAYEQFLTLSNYARGGSLDERKSPAEWIAWAASKSFIPYWLPQVRSDEVPRETRTSNYPKAVGSVAGFQLSASPIINGLTTISVGPGEVIRTDGKRILYHASSVSTSNAVHGATKRIYLHDPALALDSDIDSSVARALMANCDDDDSPRGVYEGGLIVAGHVILVTHRPAQHVEGIRELDQKSRDAVGREIDDAIARILKADTHAIINQHTVMAELIKRAGISGSCIIESVDGGLGVIWLNSAGKELKLSKDALRKRLTRRQ